MTDTLRFEQSPLDYHGHHPQRIAIYGEGASTIDGDAYFTEPDLIGFVDWTPGDHYTWIHYVCVRSDHRGEGLARRLIQSLYDATDSDMDWGEIHADEAWHLFEVFRAAYPNRFHRGKNRS